jgi:hypothetical protein
MSGETGDAGRPRLLSTAPPSLPKPEKILTVSELLAAGHRPAILRVSQESPTAPYFNSGCTPPTDSPHFGIASHRENTTPELVSELVSGTALVSLS